MRYGSGSIAIAPIVAQRDRSRRAQAPRGPPRCPTLDIRPGASADELADRIAVLDQGRIVAEGTPEELKRRVPGGHVRLQLANPPALRAAAALFDGATRDEERLVLRVPGNGDAASLRRLVEQLDQAQIAVEDLSIHSPDLDDVFFAVTGHPTIETEAA